MRTEEEKKVMRERWQNAGAKAKAMLKRGDRVRGSHGCGPKRTFTFEGWDGNWIVSKSGINDYAPSSIDRVNGVPVNFDEP